MVFFFVHWASRENSFRDMERIMRTCERCGEHARHTFRYHISKTKHYSAVSFGGGDKVVSLICHGCLLERQLDDSYGASLIEDYDMRITAWEANDLLDAGKANKAEKKLRKALKRYPGHYHCLAIYAKYHKMAGDMESARKCMDDLEEIHPEKDIKGLREEIFGKGSPAIPKGGRAPI